MTALDQLLDADQAAALRIASGQHHTIRAKRAAIRQQATPPDPPRRAGGVEDVLSLQQRDLLRPRPAPDS
jgi:hypothetical protein